MSRWTVTILVIGIIVNLLLSLCSMCLAFGFFEPWICVCLGLSSLISLTIGFGLALILKRKKVGFWIFCGGILLNVVVRTLILTIPLGFALKGLTLCWLTILGIPLCWGVLQIRRDGVKAWNTLRSGGGYKIAKKIYHVYLTLFLMGTSLTVYAGIRSHIRINEWYEYLETDTYPYEDIPVGIEDSAASVEEVEVIDSI